MQEDLPVITVIIVIHYKSTNPSKSKGVCLLLRF